MEERFQTLHPEGKQAPAISKVKYDAMRDAIVQTLGAEGAMTYAELGRRLHEQLADSFEGSISWYYTVVKLDLEARGVLERIESKASHRIRLTGRG